MGDKPKVPAEVIKEFGLKEAEELKKTVTLIHDRKHTKQYSIRVPVEFIEEVEWKAKDKIEISIIDGGLKLMKVNK